MEHKSNRIIFRSQLIKIKQTVVRYGHNYLFALKRVITLMFNISRIIIILDNNTNANNRAMIITVIIVKNMLS